MTSTLRSSQLVTDHVDVDTSRPAASPRRAAPRKWLASVLSIGVLAVVAAPVLENFRAEPRDSFPLSYYRMFSEDRADRQHLTYLEGIDPAGKRYLIPYRFAGTGGMNQVRRQINRLVDQNQAATLCRSVATRVARPSSGLPELTTVEVITGVFRLSAYFTGDGIPLEENVRARCPVGRPAR